MCEKEVDVMKEIDYSNCLKKWEEHSYKMPDPTHHCAQKGAVEFEKGMKNFSERMKLHEIPTLS